MKVKNIQSTINLPTRNVIECITGTLTEQSKKEPEKLIKTIIDVVDFDIKKQDIKEILQIPLMFDLHMLYAGNLIKNKNQKLSELSAQLKNIPLPERKIKIEETIEKIGKNINIEI